MYSKKVLYLSTKAARLTAIEECRNAPDGIRVEFRERTRSLDQNALLWSLLTEVSKKLKWAINGQLEFLSPEDWKDLFTAALNAEQRIAAGLRGGFVMLGKSTSKMSVSQMNDLITFIQAFCAEQGVDIDKG